MTIQQACDQLWTLRGAKSFLRGAQIFKLCPKHFFNGAKIFQVGIRPSAPRQLRTWYSVMLLLRSRCGKVVTVDMLKTGINNVSFLPVF